MRRRQSIVLGHQNQQRAAHVRTVVRCTAEQRVRKVARHLDRKVQLPRERHTAERCETARVRCLRNHCSHAPVARRELEHVSTAVGVGRELHRLAQAPAARACTCPSQAAPIAPSARAASGSAAVSHTRLLTSRGPEQPRASTAVSVVANTRARRALTKGRVFGWLGGPCRTPLFRNRAERKR